MAPSYIEHACEWQLMLVGLRVGVFLTHVFYTMIYRILHTIFNFTLYFTRKMRILRIFRISVSQFFKICPLQGEINEMLLTPLPWIKVGRLIHFEPPPPN